MNIMSMNDSCSQSLEKRPRAQWYNRKYTKMILSGYVYNQLNSGQEPSTIESNVNSFTSTKLITESYKKN